MAFWPASHLLDRLASHVAGDSGLQYGLSLFQRRAIHQPVTRSSRAKRRTVLHSDFGMNQLVGLGFADQPRMHRREHLSHAIAKIITRRAAGYDASA